jgi:hypothetical protein
MLLCKIGSKLSRFKFTVPVSFFEALPWFAAAR